MRGAFGTSLALHASALALAVVSIHDPEPLEARVESVNIEVVPIEEFAQVMKGAEEAALVDPPAIEPVPDDPEPTQAVNVGETEIDVDVAEAPVVSRVPVDAPPVPTAPEPDPAPTFEPVDIASVPAPAERPAAPTPERAEVVEPEMPVVAEPAPEPTPEPVEVAAAEPEPAPEPEPEPEPDPIESIVDRAVEAGRQVTERPKPEPAEPEPPQFASLPSDGPKALFRPARPSTPRAPATAEATPPKRSAPTERGEPRVTDDIRELLNRETASGGGAKRPTQAASLGGRETNGAKLTRSEIDGLRAHLQACWTAPLTSFDEQPTVKVLMVLNPDGTVNGQPRVLESSGSRIAKALEGAGTRTLRRCGPYTMLPPEKHGGPNGWNEVVVNFSLDNGVSVGG